HSSDIYPALMEMAKQQLGAGGFVEALTMRRAVTHQLEVSFDRPPNAVGSFRLRANARRVEGWLVETEDQVEDRAPFDEWAALVHAVRGDGFATFPRFVPGFSAIEHLVILMQLVSYQVGPPRHWWFGQIFLCSPLAERAPLEYRIWQTVSD